MKNPLNVKSFKELVSEVAEDPNLVKGLKELQQEAARTQAIGSRSITETIPIYEGGKLTGNKVVSEIPPHRIATQQQVKDIADSQALTLDDTTLNSVLRDHNFLAVLKGTDRVKLLGE